MFVYLKSGSKLKIKEKEKKKKKRLPRDGVAGEEGDRN